MQEDCNVLSLFDDFWIPVTEEFNVRHCIKVWLPERHITSLPFIKQEKEQGELISVWLFVFIKQLWVFFKYLLQEFVLFDFAHWYDALVGNLDKCFSIDNWLTSLHSNQLAIIEEWWEFLIGILDTVHPTPGSELLELFISLRLERSRVLLIRRWIYHLNLILNFTERLNSL